MKTFLIGFVAASVILPVAAFSYFRMGFAGVQSDATPPGWERALMRAAVHASVRRSAVGLQAPPVDKLYFNGCLGCHGEPGKPGEDFDHYPRVPQLSQVGTNYSEPELYWIVKHGIRHTAMSAYGPFYSEKQLWAIASFVRTINNLPPGVLERIQTGPSQDTSNK